MNLVNGIIETAIHVKDLRKSAEFYRSLFEFETLLDTDRLIALNIAGRSVLLLFQQGATGEPFATPGGVIPPHHGSTSGHLAFSIKSSEVQGWKKRLADAAIPIESTVQWPGGAQSLYFRDLDDHLVELLTPGFWKIY
jgi:catechol 2,3-dioxygenase-like lactoylglutathione lyase family enzyme